MDKIAMYEGLIEDHPLWTKVAKKKDDSNRKAMQLAGVASLATLAGAGVAHRYQMGRIAKHQKRLRKAYQTRARLEGVKAGMEHKRKLRTPAQRPNMRDFDRKKILWSVR